MAKLTKAQQQERAEAIARLREWIKPGDTVYTILRNVSRSGMSREIGVVLLKDGTTLHPNHSVALAIGERLGKRDGIIISGCGMDMGFHLVHSLGYVLFGRAQEGTPEGRETRRALAKADSVRCYLTQQGAKMPDPEIASREWFGAAGYALTHSWL